MAADRNILAYSLLDLYGWVVVYAPLTVTGPPLSSLFFLLPFHPRRDLMYVHSTLSVLHLEHRTPPSHFKCLLRHGTHATATEALACAALASFWLWLILTSSCAVFFTSPDGICMGGVLPLKLWLVALVDGERWILSGGDNGDKGSDGNSWPCQKAGSVPGII
jgi:hypothetical protein